VDQDRYDEIVKKLVRYSFRDIDFDFDGLTDEEKDVFDGDEDVFLDFLERVGIDIDAELEDLGDEDDDS